MRIVAGSVSVAERHFELICDASTDAAFSADLFDQLQIRFSRRQYSRLVNDFLHLRYFLRSLWFGWRRCFVVTARDTY